jgi:hypothetical protein
MEGARVLDIGLRYSSACLVFALHNMGVSLTSFIHIFTSQDEGVSFRDITVYMLRDVPGNSY